MIGNWDDLRLFLSVARAQTLSAASKQTRLDPATLSRRIARLERSTGRSLFVKSPQGYVLTEDGARLLPQAEAAEAALLAANEGFDVQGRGPGGQLTGQVRIGAPDGCANFLLPQVCTRIARDNPGLDIQIIALPRVFNLSRREADMAISVSAPSAGRLVVQKICDYHLHLAAAATYLQGKSPLLSLEDLRAHPVVGYIPDMIFDRELDYLTDLGVERVALASNSVAVQLNWIRQGGGIGVVHDFALPVVGGLRRVLTDKLSLRRTFHLVRHADDRRDARLSQFTDALLRGLRAELRRLEAMA